MTGICYLINTHLFVTFDATVLGTPKKNSQLPRSDSLEERLINKFLQYKFSSIVEVKRHHNLMRNKGFAFRQM